MAPTTPTAYALDPELAAVLPMMPVVGVHDLPAARVGFAELMAGMPAPDTTGVLTNPLYEEGAATSIVSRRYERSRAARDACIAVHGYACAVCGALMGDLYGDIGHHYIQVHHVVPLHVTAESHLVDPARDLRPLCPNCHVMIHRSWAPDGSDRIMTPDELARTLGLGGSRPPESR